MIPVFGSELDSHANLFGASEELDVLQNNQLKNNLPLVVPLPSSYAVEIH